jgi:hypothetical protein
MPRRTPHAVTFKFPLAEKRNDCATALGGAVPLRCNNNCSATRPGWLDKLGQPQGAAAGSEALAQLLAALAPNHAAPRACAAAAHGCSPELDRSLSPANGSMAMERAAASASLQLLRQ